MDQRTEIELKRKAEEKTPLLLAVIFGGLIAALIAGMFAIDIYAERLDGSTSKAKDAAEP